MRDADRRELLWRRQNGRCGYCARATILPRHLIEQFVGPFPDEETGPLIERLLATVEHFKQRWHDDLATLEHVIPKAEGGRNVLANLIMACAACNQEAGAKYLKEKERINNSPEAEFA